MTHLRITGPKKPLRLIILGVERSRDRVLFAKGWFVDQSRPSTSPGQEVDRRCWDVLGDVSMGPVARSIIGAPEDSIPSVNCPGRNRDFLCASELSDTGLAIVSTQARRFRCFPATAAKDPWLRHPVMQAGPLDETLRGLGHRRAASSSNRKSGAIFRRLDVHQFLWLGNVAYRAFFDADARKSSSAKLSGVLCHR
jgi:hypothetical protein